MTAPGRPPREGALPPGEPTVTGIDGCARGWVAVTLSIPLPPAAIPPRDSPSAQVPLAAVPLTGRTTPSTVTVAAALEDLPLAAVTGIDMPLGLLAAGWRDADRLARRALGRRGVTVFAIPPRPVLAGASYAEANRACRELTGQGLSIQAWGLRRKIAEVDQFRHRTATAPDNPAPDNPAPDNTAPDNPAPSPARLYEVHPELAFAALAGAPLPDSKHTPAGLAVRRELLRRAGLTLPVKLPGLPDNDLLDAAAVAWSAHRIAAGQAVVLTNPDQRADDGSEIAIRY